MIPCEYDAIRTVRPAYDREIAYRESSYTQEMAEQELYDWKENFIPASCTDGYVIVSRDGAYALLDKAGKEIIPFGTYEVLTEVHNNCLYAKKEQKWGIINLLGEETDVTAEIDGSEQGGTFDGVLGSCFDVPEGFLHNSDVTPANGFCYEFVNLPLNMTISVTEIPFVKLPHIDERVAMQKEYEWLLEKVLSNTAIAYNEGNETEYIVSGVDGEEIYYYKGINHNNDIYAQITIKYLSINKESCDKILEEVLEAFRWREVGE